MSGDNFPQWIARFLIWGSTCLGGALLALLVYVWTGVSAKVEALDARTNMIISRQDVLDAKIEGKLDLIVDRLDRLSRKMGEP